MKVKLRWKAVSMLLVCSLVLSGLTGIRAEAKSSVISICKEEEWEVLKLVNKERSKKGLVPLSVTRKLQSANDTRAKEIYQSFSHTRPDGSSCFTALSDVGEDYNYAGENIAAGYASPEAVMQGWMNSPGHKANILTANYTHMGVGYYYKSSGMYRYYWTQMFTGSCSPKSISVQNASKVSSYKLVTTIEDMDRVLVIKCQHGTSYMPITAKMCKGYNKNTTGTKTIKVSFQGKTASFKVKVTGTSIRKAKVTNIKTKTYTGKAQTQKPKVVLKGKVLVKGKDYTLSYKNNKKPGTATVIITGKGKYSGTIKKNFKIVRKKA